MGVLLGAAAISAGCSDDEADNSPGGDSVATAPSDGGSTAVAASVKEWSVQADAPSAPPGEVTFTVTNEGTVTHEFLVVRTDAPDGSIPLDGDHFSEDDPAVTVVDEISEFAAGDTKTLTVSLEAGTYQLVCNLPGHYANGMHTPFAVSGQTESAEPVTTGTTSDTTTSDTTPGGSAPGSTQSDLESGGVGNDPGEG